MKSQEHDQPILFDPRTFYRLHTHNSPGHSKGQPCALPEIIEFGPCEKVDPASMEKD